MPVPLSEADANTDKAVNIRRQFRKTKMCAHYLIGACAFGSKCYFAHSQIEMQPRPDLAKTKFCQKWLQGSCHAKECTFAHGPGELRGTNGVYKTVLCHWWELGKCALGEACRYAHGEIELRKKEHQDENTPGNVQRTRSKTVDESTPRSSLCFALDADAPPRSRAETAPELSSGLHDLVALVAQLAAISPERPQREAPLGRDA